eukprot:6925280-Pyramimonas_sp.AAC.1
MNTSLGQRGCPMTSRSLALKQMYTIVVVVVAVVAVVVVVTTWDDHAFLKRRRAAGAPLPSPRVSAARPREGGSLRRTHPTSQRSKCGPLARTGAGCELDAGAILI